VRKEGPVALGLIAGLLVIVSNFFGGATLVLIKSRLDQYYLVTQAFICGVGLANLAVIHGNKISRKREGYGYSYVMFASMAFMLIFGLLMVSSTSDPKFQWVFQATISPMNATMYSILVFYIASAAYRAFRVRTAEATVLLVAGVIMMLGRVSVGAMIHPQIPVFAQWILDWPNTAGMRGIQVGATLGGISTALRIMTGIERGHLGGVE